MAIRRLVRHPYFKPLAVLTCGYVITASIFFYYFESASNPLVTNIGTAFGWVTSTVPFFGRFAFHPVTNEGRWVASAAHFVAFFLTCFWLGLVGTSIFTNRKATKKG